MSTSFQQTDIRRALPHEQIALDRAIYISSKLGEHLASCKDASCHIRRAFQP